MVKKAVIILSGGPDSSTVAYWAKSKGFDLYGLAFNYGQIASKETACAKLIADKLKIPLKIINLIALKEVFSGVTALCDENMRMPSKFEPTIIVPFRNAIFLSIAVAYATSIQADTVFYGAQGSDAPFYPDCRREFFKAFQKAAQLGTETKIKIEAPFYNLKKSDIIKLGKSLNVPYELTWSCYLNGDKHCGKCESCINRKNAFKEAGVEDPTEYQT
ncbi:MAG: 7-cyano-7-deazaguanine synthase QueC [Candidatus Odinarchaeia archaeon]